MNFGETIEALKRESEYQEQVGMERNSISNLLLLLATKMQ